MRRASLRERDCSRIALVALIADSAVTRARPPRPRSSFLRVAVLHRHDAERVVAHVPQADLLGRILSTGEIVGVVNARQMF